MPIRTLEVAAPKLDFKKLIKEWSIYNPVMGQDKKANVPAVVKKLVKEFGKTPYQINDGECDDFADKLQEQIGGVFLQTAPWDGNFVSSQLPGHAWVYWGGRHYDAETPNGVADWKQLPIFKKMWGDIKWRE
jgi:hypothetical protein